MRRRTSEPVREPGTEDIDELIFFDTEYEISRR